MPKNGLLDKNKENIFSKFYSLTCSTMFLFMCVIFVVNFSFVLNLQKRDSKIPDDTETEEVGEDGDEVVEYPTDPDIRGQTFPFQREMQDLLASLSPKESTCSSRRSSIKDDDPFAHLTSKRKGKHVRMPHLIYLLVHHDHFYNMQY